MYYFFFRTEPFQIETFKFDPNILDVYKGNLQTNRLALDDLTIDNLKAW